MLIGLGITAISVMSTPFILFGFMDTSLAIIGLIYFIGLTVMGIGKHIDDTGLFLDSSWKDEFIEEEY